MAEWWLNRVGFGGVSKTPGLFWVKRQFLLVLPSLPRPWVGLATTWAPLPPLLNLPGQLHHAQRGGEVVIMSGVAAPGAEVAALHNLGKFAHYPAFYKL